MSEPSDLALQTTGKGCADKTMKTLIFGRGRIAEERYSKYLAQALKRKDGSDELEINWIDKGKSGCADADTW